MVNSGLRACVPTLLIAVCIFGVSRAWRGGGHRQSDKCWYYRMWQLGGRNYVRHFVQIPGAGLVTCCDTNPEVLLAVRERYPLVRLTKNYRDITADPKIDAVIIATPPGDHYRIARACLLRGKHVLVEKPFTLSSEEGYQLADIAEKTGKVLMVGHIMDYHPGMRLVKKYIESGELGKIFLSAFYSDKPWYCERRRKCTMG